MTPPSILVPARLARRPVLGTQTDERLVALVRAGNDAAFEAIVARYRRPILRYATRILGDGRAEDAVQQTFVNAYNAMRRDDSELRLRPWLYRIAHNAALNALRDWGPGYEQLPEGLDGVEQPDQALERRQRLRDVMASVRSLPERQRDAIVLRELEGRSYDEIAAELGVTGGAVRQLLNRARHAVRAGATALMPVGLLARIPWGEATQPLTARIAELCGAAGTGATIAKVCVTALVTGAVAGGASVLPDDDRTGPEGAAPAAAATAHRSGAAGRLALRAPDPGRDGLAVAAPVEIAGGEPEDRSAGGRRESERDSDDRSGRGGEDDEAEEREDNSGPGGGVDDDSGHSGSGHSGSDDSGHGGSGSSGSGSDNSGPGSFGSGSGSSGSGSGSSGSGSDSSGSGSSGSGLSGSGSSGSGSSGSGSGEELALDAPDDSSGSGSGSSGSGSGDSEPSD